MNDDELSRLIHESIPAPPASAEHLEAILALHSRRRRAVATALVAVFCLVSAGLVVVARSSGPTAQRVQAPATLGPTLLADAVATQPSPSPSGPSPTPPISFERLFLRTTAGGVTLRVYLGTIHGPLPCPPGQSCPPPQCWPHTIVHVGLSTDNAVGEMAAPADGPAPELIALVGATGFGLPGVSSNFALLVRAGTAVTTLRMRFANGDTDQMAPIQGWAVLAHSGDSPFGTLEAIGAAGNVIASTPIPPQPNATPPQNGPSPAGAQCNAAHSPPGAAGQPASPPTTLRAGGQAT